MFARFPGWRISPGRSGSVIVGVLVLVVVTMIVLSATLSWSFTNVRLNHRHNQYSRCVAAAEAATEKALVTINTDYKNHGQAYVERNLSHYRQLVPTTTETKSWADFRFFDSRGYADSLDVVFMKATNLVPVSKNYKGLLGFPSTFRISASASERYSPVKVQGAVLQEVQVSLIPIFQFAMFYNMDYECAPGAKMDITGPVHCNGDVYLNPGNVLTYWSDVTCTGKIIRGPKSGSGQSMSSGSVVYKAAHDGRVSNLTLPIGTNNSIIAVRQVVEKPPPLESPDSSMGQQRLYNKADMVITVTEQAIAGILLPQTVVTVTSGRADNFKTVVPSIQTTQFINTAASFYNSREKKTVKAVQIDIGAFKVWNETNEVLRSVLFLQDVRIIYVADQRPHASGNMPGIRLVNGALLPKTGLTIATPNPLYIRGDYNCPNPTHLGTLNTSQTAPAAVIADAITILSSAWDDTKTTVTANNTTVNTAIIAGIVQTASGKGYSGGVENFLRFLENWSGKTLTYSGSLSVMYESKFANTPWGGTTYYSPPIRNWAFDQNFRSSDKLPPGTPSAYVLTRGEWQIVAAR